jgi:hypothetical protein
MKKLNKRGAKRLLNVARALMESTNPDSFTMLYFFTGCGTPACALGHYADRIDLQRAFISGDKYYCIDTKSGDNVVEVALCYFGITRYEYAELFDESGCNNAKTAVEAAKYIQDFVKRRRPEVL